MKSAGHVIKRNIKNLWIISLLLYSLFILIYHAFTNPLPVILDLPLLVFLPGYAFVEVSLSRIPILEKITLSLALSLALLVGIRSLIHVFIMTDLISEKTMAAIIAVVCLSVELYTRNARFNISKIMSEKH